MSTKKTLLTGTLTLTIAGILSRLLGFYYKIFLSNAIGSTAFGMCQMVLPISALGLSLCCGGIQPVLQKHIAAALAEKKEERVHGFLLTGLLATVILSVPVSVVLYCNAELVALRFLGSNSYSPLLQIISLSFAPACIHNCIHAYFLGCSQTLIPSLAQLFEQLARIGSVWFLVNLQHSKGLPSTASLGVAGILFGEAASSLFCLTFYLCKKGRKKADCKNTLKPLVSMTVPLTANRIFLHLFQSLEAVLIPSCLCLYGLTYEDSVGIYGVITGMAMSLVMLPSTLIHSFAVMLLPEVSNAKTQNNQSRLVRTCNFSLVCCMYIGILCTAEFTVFGREASSMLFGDKSVGDYVCILAWLCPFMYLTSSFFSILNGMGKTGTNFAISMGCTMFRILAIWIFTPRFGIEGLLLCFLFAQLLLCIISFFAVRKWVALSFSAFRLIMIPSVCAVFASAIAKMMYKNMPAEGLLPLLLSGMVLACIYGICVFACERLQ